MQRLESYFEELREFDGKCAKTCSEYERGLGKVSHDRVHAWLVSTMADVASHLSQRPDELDDYLRRRIGVLMREAHHPNPSQPRRVTAVVEVLEAEMKYLPQAA